LGALANTRRACRDRSCVGQTLYDRELNRPPALLPRSPEMSNLLVGFDSAWTATKSGAIAGLIHRDDGTFVEIGLAQTVDYPQAEALILKWQADFLPVATVIMLDQPTIVPNTTGQRPVENIVGSPVSLRYGGVQPANTSREEMFGVGAPVWPFLRRFGGPADPIQPAGATWVFETYPVLAMIALEWTRPDVRSTGRLPKYNPERRRTFTAADWQHVCGLTVAAFSELQLMQTAAKIAKTGLNLSPRKSDQDDLDACLCLLVAIRFSQGHECLMVGDMQTGYIVVPGNNGLWSELEARCHKTGRIPSQWIRRFQTQRPQQTPASSPI
jgi:predicted RNase H-like nuclease